MHGQSCLLISKVDLGTLNNVNCSTGTVSTQDFPPSCHLFLSYLELCHGFLNNHVGLAVSFLPLLPSVLFAALDCRTGMPQDLKVEFSAY